MFYDSGFGGFSILKPYLDSSPYCNTILEVIYLADQAFFPYGQKSQLEIQARATHLIKMGSQMWDPDIIVLACNTLSTLALSHLRSIFETPIVGVVPAVKPACAASKMKSIGVLVTSETANSDYYKNLIADFAKDCKVQTFGCRYLAGEIEEFIVSEGRQFLSQDLIALQSNAHSMDALVLGCTHYPLIESEIIKILHNGAILIFHSGEAVAKRIHQLTSTKNGTRSSEEGFHPKVIKAYSTNISNLKKGQAFIEKYLVDYQLEIHEFPEKHLISENRLPQSARPE